MAGPFTRADFEKLVSADKKLSPEWLRSLTERGQPTVYRGADLEKIGMPIGGICAGQVYLGGDGRLWHWDIFNRRVATGAEHYAKPLQPTSPLDQGFALRIRSVGQVQDRTLDRAHWRDVSFRGEYPIGFVEYRDADSPVSVHLEAFSPFVPLNTEVSSLPATVMQFTVTNHSRDAVEAELAGWLENAVCPHSAQLLDGFRRNRLVRRDGALFLECGAEEAPGGQPPQRPDIVFEDFEHETYGDWVVTGTAFGSGPVEMANIPAYQGDVGGKGRRVVNTHASVPANTVEGRDAAVGTLTSPSFVIERNYVTFLIGGGSHKDRTCMNLLVEEQLVRTATGENDNRMKPTTWDVRRWAGKTARLQIVDNASEGWGNIGVDHIVFSDRPGMPLGPLAQQEDFGSMVLAVLDARQRDSGRTALPGGAAPSGMFSSTPLSPKPTKYPFGQKLVGSLTRRFKLAPGAATQVTFVIAWHMLNLNLSRLPPRRYYATRFASALDVASYVVNEFPRLARQTRLWHDTWYDSTLPYWFLDRTFLNTSILATSTCHRLGNGRFYGWEGVGCCEGTCGHVWQYAHAVARLFPGLERQTREQVDLGLALQPDGAIHFRGEFNDIAAIDAQAGTILRALREHQMLVDDAFLKRNWPRIKKAMDWLIAKDANDDGLIEGNQHNTLDTDWFGPVAWLSGLYLAALRAAEAMGLEMGDTAYAEKCRAIFQAGQKNFVNQLYAEGYFQNRPDPQHLDAINSGSGCHIDQVFGQSWAFQVGLPRVLPEEQTVSALKSLWRYNFTPDVGPYREAYKAGRWYAMPGEAGLLMCTFPQSDWDYAQAKGKGPEWAAGYFNECMNGFEYQAAGHMLWEGLVTEGLAVTRAVHDRYHAARRNPWNEVECGDHYARSMASYGVFLAACGFTCHGPKKHIGFAPRLAPENFKAPFTAAEGWGTFSQKQQGGQFQAKIHVAWGKLRLKQITLARPRAARTSSVRFRRNGRAINGTHEILGTNLRLTLAAEQIVVAGEKLEVIVT